MRSVDSSEATEHALSSAARSGLMAMTGRHDGPPVAPPDGMVAGLDRLALAVEEHAESVGATLAVRWEPLVLGRAALLGLGRNGQVSANGTCRLLRAADGWIAVNLPRADDVELAGVLAGGGPDPDPWPGLAGHAAERLAADTVAGARLLGLPAAVLAPPTDAPAWRQERRWPSAAPRLLRDVRVVDLSAMWAGPLAARLLSAGGAEVVKVESTTRPDGARAVPEFYRWLHPEAQQVVTVDFASVQGRDELRSLLGSADVVIEASRPRALEQLGVDPSSLAPRPGRVWLSITGHGRLAPARDWVAFGDDAAVAAGLVGWDERAEPVFCADAVADPVTGLTATVAVCRALAGGGGVLLDVSLASSAAAIVTGGGFGRPGRTARRAAGGQWVVDLADRTVAVAGPARWFASTSSPPAGGPDGPPALPR